MEPLHSSAGLNGGQASITRSRLWMGVPQGPCRFQFMGPGVVGRDQGHIVGHGVDPDPKLEEGVRVLIILPLEPHQFTTLLAISCAVSSSLSQMNV